MNSNSRVLFPLFFLIGLLLAPPAQALEFGDSLGLSPFWDWRTIETARFRVTYPAPLEKVAEKSAQYLEQTHALLSGPMQWEPKTKTQILVIDNTDYANGLASAVGRFGLVLFAVPPETWFSTTYYDDWLRLLVVHEYTHYLNMDARRSFYDPLQLVFGDAIRPNALWPTWLLEGFAVYNETRFTQLGRGRSSDWDRILRTAVAENALDRPDYVTLDRIHGPNPFEPVGETAYLFGYSLVNHFASQNKNESALGTYSLRSAGRIPYFLNSAMTEDFPKDWIGYWQEWVDSTTRRQKTALGEIRSQPVTQVQALSPPAHQILGPAVSPDGKKIVYSQDNSDETEGMYLLDLAGSGKPVRLTDRMGGASTSFSKDGKFVFYSSLTQSRIYYSYSDLYAFDLERKKEFRLTQGLRAKDPDLSPDQKNLVFTLVENSTVLLASAEVFWTPQGPRLGEIKKLLVPSPMDRIAQPKFSPDGTRVVFTWQHNGKPGNNLEEYRLKDGATRVLVANGKQQRFPAFSPDGKLHFVSDLGGVDNLYRLGSETQSPTRVTNVETGVWLPAFSSDGRCYAAVYGLHGWSLAELTLRVQDQLKLPPQPAPEPAASAPPTSSIAESQKSGYSIFPSIWPRQWAPLFIASEEDTYLGGQVLGFDATDRHRYLLGAAYQFLLREWNWYASYENRMFGPTLGITSQSQVTEIYSSVASNKNYLKESEFSVAASYPIPLTRAIVQPQVKFAYEKDELYYSPIGGRTPVARSLYVPSLTYSLSFSDREQPRLGVAPERGGSVTVAAKNYFGPTLTSWKYFAKAERPFKIVDHWALAPKAAAIWAPSPVNGYTDSFAVASNVTTGLAFGRESTGVDRIRMRGYSNQRFVSRIATQFGADTRFPIFRILRGWETRPVFVRNLEGSGFGETTFFPVSGTSLPAVGGGLHLGLTLFYYVPVELSAEYHQGLNSDFAGQGEIVGVVSVSGLVF